MKLKELQKPNNLHSIQNKDIDDVLLNIQIRRDTPKVMTVIENWIEDMSQMDIPIQSALARKELSIRVLSTL